jgi:hypothetical protein|tara:strand:+ start:159 stop:308 length:150 start_codon:yes stop_codon:yes gene_type:complete
MESNSTSNNVDNDQFTLNKEENDYINLITRLKEINITISLLKKKYLDKV